MDNEKDIFSSEDYLGINNIKKKDIITNNVTKSSFSLKFKPKSLNNEVDVGKENKPTIKEIVNQSATTSGEMHTENNYLIAKEPEVKHEAADLHESVLNNMIGTGKDSTMQTLTTEKEASKGLTLTKFNSLIKNLQVSKVFANKNSKIAVMVVILAIVLIVFLNLSSNSKTNLTNSSVTNFNSLEYVSSAKYVNNLESKLVSVLSKVKGAGQVEVMVTLESGPELKIATSVDERTNTSTSSSTTTTSVTVIENPIIITQNGQSQPLVLMEIMPKIKGVIVVAQGAGSTKVKLELLEAVQALLDVPSSNIQIYAGI